MPLSTCYSQGSCFLCNGIAIETAVKNSEVRSTHTCISFHHKQWEIYFATKEHNTCTHITFGEVKGMCPGEDMKLLKVAGEGIVTSLAEPGAG